MTSHDCVARVRRLLRLKRVGHGGTLDPAATGVLPIAIAQATRLLQFMRQDKAYRATIRLGIRTATDDLEGETLQEMPVPALNFELVKAALDGFVGEIQQVPPAYSAIQVQGQRLYDLARAGETVEVPARSVEVYKIEVLDWRPGDFPEIDAAIACGPGTYIRAIARDLGELLKTGGTLAALTRTASSGFALSDSLTFDELEAQLKQGTFQPVLPEVALQHIQSVILSAPNDLRWCQGQKIVDFRFSSPDSALKQSIESVGSQSISIPERDSDSYPFATPDNLVPLTQRNVLPPSENSYNPQPDRLKSKIDNPNSILRVYDDNGHFLGIGQLTHSEIEPLLIPQVVLNSIQ